MKKTLFISAFTIASFAFAQEEKLEITYSSKIILPEDFTFQPPGGNGRQMPKEMQDQMIKNIQEPQENILTIDGEISTYKIVEKISNEQQNGFGGRGGMRMMRFGGNDNIFKDISTKSYIKEVNLFTKSYTVKDNLPNFDWKLSRETKTILGNEVRKATTEIDGKTVVAWYTTKIPVKTGPENYWGLPGLILEISTDIEQGPIKGKKIITITDIKTLASNKNLEIPKYKTTITEADLKKLQEEQRQRFEQMRDQGVNRRVD